MVGATWRHNIETWLKKTKHFSAMETYSADSDDVLDGATTLISHRGWNKRRQFKRHALNHPLEQIRAA